jgi:hypothetical protein
LYAPLLLPVCSDVALPRARARISGKRNDAPLPLKVGWGQEQRLPVLPPPKPSSWWSSRRRGDDSVAEAAVERMVVCNSENTAVFGVSQGA